MIPKTNFKQMLLKSSHVLAISKSDCDLFLLAQTNTITYQQLELSHLHGINQTGGRLSLKKLEQEGYITSKLVPGTNRRKFYILTAKGKKRLEKIFSVNFFHTISINLDRKPPTSQQQLPHRIHTNDLYYAYISCPTLPNLPIWKLEDTFYEDTSKQQLPRCDALLITGSGNNYYIEQDNCTQGDNALETKILQYMNSNLFLGKNIQKNILIFTLYTENKNKLSKKPAYSIYRILLKAIRVWNTLEQENRNTYSFFEFCQQFNNSSSYCLYHLSTNDREILQNLCYQYPNIYLKEVIKLKKEFLYDTTQQMEQQAERDLLFKKRLRRKFYQLLENKNNATLIYRLRKGMDLYIIPNHQHGNYLPFIFQKEYQIYTLFSQILFHFGLTNLEMWEYYNSYSLQDIENNHYIFSNTFIYNDTLIVFEDIAHNLGSRERIRFYLRNHKHIQMIIFILFVHNEDDANFFLSEEITTLQNPKNKDVQICFLEKTATLLHTPSCYNIYSYDINFSNHSIKLHPVFIDFDDFNGELHILRK